MLQRLLGYVDTTVACFEACASCCSMDTPEHIATVLCLGPKLMLKYP